MSGVCDKCHAFLKHTTLSDGLVKVISLSKNSESCKGWYAFPLEVAVFAYLGKSINT